MPSIRLCEDELTALYGLPHLSIVLYMLGLRPRMDFSTGMVGAKPLISWQALREACYVEPHSGTKHQYASPEAVRRAAVWLEKAGLIRMKSLDRQLIFFLPLAHADYSARKKADRGPTDQPDRGPTDQNPHEQEVSVESKHASRQTKKLQADSHPESGKPIKTSPPTPPISDSGKTGAGDEEKFIYPKNMTSHQRAAIALKIGDLGVDIGQAVLDELAGCIQAGAVKNLPGLTRFFVEQAEKGEFMPDKGVAIRAARQARIDEEKRRQEYERRATEEAKQTTKGAGKPGRLADLLKPGRVAA